SQVGVPAGTGHVPNARLQPPGMPHPSTLGTSHSSHSMQSSLV
ncbi:hypothetical protein XELAEV_1803989720mg, partial [Xenopus laevis]